MDRATLAQHNNPIGSPCMHTERSPHAHRIPCTRPGMRHRARTEQRTRTGPGVSVDARYQGRRPAPRGEKQADRADGPRDPTLETERPRRPTTSTPSAPLDGAIAKQKGVGRRLAEMRKWRGARAGRRSWIDRRARQSSGRRQQHAHRRNRPDSFQPISPIPTTGIHQLSPIRHPVEQR
jgi:hypothetical protein